MVSFIEGFPLKRDITLHLSKPLFNKMINTGHPSGCERKVENTENKQVDRQTTDNRSPGKNKLMMS